MRILILTQYYLPETGAPQKRLSCLAFYLQAFGNNVEVLTALPNYPRSEIYPEYKNTPRSKEAINNIIIHRSNIWVSKKKSIFFRLITYFSFVLSSLIYGLSKLKKFDIIICESPPLFLGLTAMALKIKWKCKLVFNVSDLWPESAEKLGIIKNRFFLYISYKLEQYIYKRADLISCQTKGIVETIRQTISNKKLLWAPNGADINQFKETNATIKNEAVFNLLYAGIIGHAQGLEVIMYAAAKLHHIPPIKFYIIGDGPVKEQLLELKNKLHLSNVHFISNQPAEKITEWIEKCDAYIVPLKKIDLFKGAIPSKLFEPLAAGKPVLLGVDGEAKELFINEANGGLYFTPENADELADCILQLYNKPALAAELGSNGKQYVYKYFTREKIAQEFWKALQALYIQEKIKAVKKELVA